MRTVFSLAALASITLLAACGGGAGGAGAYGGAVATTPATSGAAMPQTATVAGSQAFVSASNQHTLYVWTGDSNGVSNCNAGCTSVWFPEHPSSANVQLSAGFSIITRGDGTLQYAFNGAALYQYAGDSGALQSNGEGVVLACSSNQNGCPWHVAR